MRRHQAFALAPVSRTRVDRAWFLQSLRETLPNVYFNFNLRPYILGSKGDLDSVKICDLGLARKATEKLTNAMIGTPRYVSPEIIFSAEHTRSFGPAVDSWAGWCKLTRVESTWF